MRKELGNKSFGRNFLEYFIIILSLCVLALRATTAEVINISASNPWLNQGNEIAGVILTAVLLFCVVLWLLSAALRKSFELCFTSLEGAALLFVIAGLVGIVIASDKRAAVNDYITLTVPILLAIVLAQVLTSPTNIRVILAIVIALACASTWQCSGQYFYDTQAMVEQYEADPQAMLQSLGLARGSFEHWLFEHRLYTKGVSGFLTTGNSVASFAILAVFAVGALLLERIRLFKKGQRSWPALFITAVIFGVILLNFFFVRSKGGVAALALSVIILVILLAFGSFLKKYRNLLIPLLFVFVAVALVVVVNYGLVHDRLPGGNSMLVRWQYWTAAGRMYTDYTLTGVGPGNFATYYTHYKAPAALETVIDPHNFPLSILTQYGPVGLIGFLALLLAPFWRFLKSSDSVLSVTDEKPSAVVPVFMGVLVTLSLLIFRPILNPMDTSLAVNQESIIAAAYFLYIEPAVVFFVAFIFIWFACRILPLSGLTICALICAYIGVAVHNLVDFAIFEPGVYTTFWLLIACLVATQTLSTAQPALIVKPGRPTRIILLLLCVAIAWLYGAFVFVPVFSRNNALIAAKAVQPDMSKSQHFLSIAGRADSLSPQPYLASGNLYLQTLDYYDNREQALADAENSLLTAARRSPADFKPWQNLSEVYKMQSELTDGREKQTYLRKYFDAAAKTVELYPGLGRLRMTLADAAESLGKKDIALINYKKAVEIEDAYRKQFKIMYPERELFSRLGEKNYQLAKQKISRLQ